MTGGPIELRAVLVVVFASLLFTALTPVIYRRDPARRRFYLTALAVILLVAPWWTAAGLFTWPLGLHHPSPGLLAQPVPWLLTAVWWFVGLALVGRTIVRIAAGRRALGDLPPFGDPQIDTECRRLGARLGLKRPVTVRIGSTACASSLAGLVVMLPEAARGWPAQVRSAVLAHELAHLARRDDRQLLLLRLLIDWYWWMPWLGGLHRRYLEAVEESCDDRASALLPCRSEYVSGLVQAARSLSRGSRPDAPGLVDRHDPLPTWVALLGHSHLAVRVQRLLAVPRPTLDHADGRWALFWASLLFGLGLTAEPAAVPERRPAAAGLFPLTVAAPSMQPDRERRPPRVETRTQARHPAGGGWRPVPASARDPLPVYPAEALQQGLGGTVTVELQLRRTPAGLVSASLPDISSTDPSGLLAAAVSRAVARARSADLSAGLRAIPPIGRHPNLHAAPGSNFRLRTIYRFVPGSGPAGRRQETEP